MNTDEEIQMNNDEEVPEADPEEVDALIEELEKKAAPPASAKEASSGAGEAAGNIAKEARIGSVFIGVYDDAMSDDAIVALFKNVGWLPVGLTHNETQIGIQSPGDKDVAVAYSGGRFFLFEGKTTVSDEAKVS